MQLGPRIRHVLMAIATTTVLAGCGAMPTIPGTGQSTPTTTYPAPQAPAPTATVTPATSATPAPSTVSSTGCDRESPAGNPTIGVARQGDYLGQQLPQGYEVYSTEAQVTAAIQKIYDARSNWPCFQKFYPGASAVFQRKGRL